MSVAQKKRSEIDARFKWRIEDLYPNTESWRAEFSLAGEDLGRFEQYRGRLADTDALLECLKAKDEASERAEKLYVYATMKLHEDSGDSASQGMADQAESLLVRLMAAMSFIDSEILAVDRAVIERAMGENAGLALYRHMLEDLLRVKEHVLSPQMEELLAQAGEIGQAPDNIFAMLNDADMKFGFVADESGNVVELTQGRYLSLMESKNRDVRKNAFETYYAEYIKLKNTLAATYNASVKKDAFFSRARKYESALHGALSGYNIPREVYMNLVAAVRESLPLLHRYMALRKASLGVPELHMYDLYTPIVKDAETGVTYDQAKATVLKALAPLGDAYVAKVAEAYENGWIDVYENEGKRSGAYAWGAYGAHPFMLLNFDDKINDMFTLAHETGHAMHSYYSWSTQPYVYADYTIFVAEVASTVNECLLMDYLLKTTADETMRKYLINYYLEQFRGTVFRQTMFAEFEMATHDMVERGEPLTVDALCALYRGLNRDYYGKGVTLDEQIDMEWARIPHFYSAFYVYQYATGFSAAAALSKGILEEGGQRVQDYLGFLSGGGSDYSINLLKKAGVDMSKPEPVRQGLKIFEELLGRMEEML